MSRHQYDCRVRFSDVDVYGHVNNVKYFEYYQEARLGFLSSLGSGEGNFALVVARVEVDYKRPIVFRTEPYTVDTWVVRVGNSSFTFGSEFRDGAEVLSRAETVLVTFDTERQKARPLRQVERERLLAET